MIPYRSKYNAKKTIVDGIKFDSKKESERYLELKILEAQGKISNLKLQVPFPITINNKRICTYKADFSYESEHDQIIEDVKGFKTPVYKLKKKLVEAFYDIRIDEI